VTVPARALHAAVRAYRRVFAARPSPCRFQPTCSAYALDALEQHGAARGTWLTTRRLCRCHPWGGHGWDPVPPPRKGLRRA
jgi:putative membrane protein insertion efficiency factor